MDTGQHVRRDNAASTRDETKLLRDEFPDASPLGHEEQAARDVAGVWGFHYRNSFAVWFLCAALSVVTSRYLLFAVESLYPHHFLIVHASVAVIFKNLRYHWNHPQTATSWTQLYSKSQHSQRHWIQVGNSCAYCVCTVLSLVCGYQAFNYVPTLATLLFVTTIGWRPESLFDGFKAAYLQGFSWRFALQLVVFVTAVTLIFTQDAFPNALGNLFALLSAGSAGFAASIRARTRDQQRGAVDRGMVAFDVALLDSVALMSVLGTSIILVCISGNSGDVSDLGMGAPSIILLNILSSAMAIDYGGSVFRRVSLVTLDDDNPDAPYAMENIYEGANTATSLSTLILAGEAMLDRTVVINLCQIYAFGVAAMALQDPHYVFISPFCKCSSLAAGKKCLKHAVQDAFRKPHRRANRFVLTLGILATLPAMWLLRDDFALPPVGTMFDEGLEAVKRSLQS